MLVRGSVKICSFFLSPLLFLFFLWSVFSILEKNDRSFKPHAALSRDGMASDPVQANPHLSMRNGCRCVTEPGR